MSEKRRALGRGLGALIPTSSGTARPVDVFFRDADTPGSHVQIHRGNDVQHEPRDRSDDSDRHEPNTLNGNVPVSRTVATNGFNHATGAGEAADNGTGDAPLGDDSWDLAPVPGAVFAELPISAIRPNPKQPRTVFDEDEMAELSRSIAEIGVLQPVVVRRVASTDHHSTEPGGLNAADPVSEDGAVVTRATGQPQYELIMGERRLRASEQAGLTTIPAIIKDTQDNDLLRDALLENLHRSQLNPLEEAAAYQQLLDDFGCSHEELATRIGRSRPQISNTLRLLRLPPLVARRLAAGVLSAGHARALLSLDDGAAMERLAQRIVAEGLSVRSIEEIVAVGGDAAPRARRPRAGGRHPQLDGLASRLSDHFDTRVLIALGQRKGKVTVEFASVDDLNRIVRLMDVQPVD